MITHLLTLNAGSSSLKFALFEADGRAPVPRPRGKSRRWARRRTSCCVRARAISLRTGFSRKRRGTPTNRHESALQHILDTLRSHFPAMNVEAVGHRVVHGGPRYAEPLRLTPEIVSELEEFIPLAPLHQPHNLSGISAAQRAFPDAMQIACFDTAFHRTHPWVNDTFALPRSLYEKGIRRYGFHGLSYEYVAGRLGEIAPDIAAGRAVIAPSWRGCLHVRDQERP